MKRTSQIRADTEAGAGTEETEKEEIMSLEEEVVVTEVEDAVEAK